MITYYRILWLFLWPLLPFFWLVRVAKGKEVASRLPERLGLRGAPKKWTEKRLCPPPIIHIHGASVGECKSLEPLLKELLKDNTHVRLVVTSGTKTSASVIAKMLQTNSWNKRIEHRLLPWDIWPCVALFYRNWKPDVTVMCESELWPELLHQATKRPHKPVLINARVSGKSFARYSQNPKLAKSLYGCFGSIFARSQLDAERLQALGFASQQKGDIKYDALALPYHDTMLKAYAKQLAGKQIIVAASTHAPEEKLILDAAANIPNSLCILIPRHPERGTALASEFNLPQRSTGAKLLPQGAGYLADTLGELGLWYALAARTNGVVVMGGSFSEHVQGHNPLEPVKLGAKTLCGAHMGNFTDMVRDLGQSLHHTKATAPEALAKAIQTSLKAPAPKATALPQGATVHIANHLRGLLA